MRPLNRFLPVLLATSALGLSLTACRQDDALSASQMAWPQTAAAPYPADYYGDQPARIPVGRPVSYDDGWAWAERSYALDRAFYDTPPDYGFYYDDYQPWVWQTDDRWAMYGDPYDDDWRYYYYQPGATRPYFIRDANYGYGYDDVGRLVAIFSLLTGQLMPQDFLYRQDPIASGYYQRAYLVREASLRAEPIVISRQVWLQEQPVIVRTQNIWMQSAGKQKDWVRYRERTNQTFVRAFDDDRRRREVTLASAKPGKPDKGAWFGQGRAKDKAPARAERAPRDKDRLAEARPGRSAKPDRRVEQGTGSAKREQEARGQERKAQAQQLAQRQAQANQQHRAEAQAKERQRQDVADAERRAAHAQQQQKQRDAAQARADKQVRDQQRQAQAQQQRAQAEQGKAQHGQKARQETPKPQQAQQASPPKGEHGQGKGQGGGGKEAAADQPKDHGGGKGKKG